VVLSRDEVGRILKPLTAVSWIIVALLYGAGLRLQEGLELRVKDVDFDLNQIAVRRGKGQKDRRTMLPALVKERLRAHLADVKQQHERDLAAGRRLRHSHRAGVARPFGRQYDDGVLVRVEPGCARRSQPARPTVTDAEACPQVRGRASRVTTTRASPPRAKKPWPMRSSGQPLPLDAPGIPDHARA
jgi:hypothetical protein